MVREAWLNDSIEKKEAQPLDAYDFVSDLVVGGKGIPLDKQDPSEEAFETITTEVYVYICVCVSYPCLAVVLLMYSWLINLSLRYMGREVFTRTQSCRMQVDKY